MNASLSSLARLLAATLLLSVVAVSGQDWPQWLGPNRDGKVTGFRPPQIWPKQLSQKWKVTVGSGVSTPALLGDRLYVFTRQDASETLLCLNAADGKEIWKDQYETRAVTGPAAGFAGPRSSPTVADGKVITLGVAGVLSCYDATKGTMLWRKTEFGGAVPRFFASSSPIVLDNLCIVQLGGAGNGGIVAFDLATGSEKWKWTGDAPAYASPTLMTVAGTKLIVASTEGKMVAVSAADGKQVWEAAFRTRYNASSPFANGDTLFYSGPGVGTTAVKFEREGDGFAVKQLWNNPECSVIYNTPVLKNGFVYGASDRDVLWCLNAQDGKTAWTAPIRAAASAGNEGQPGGGGGGRRGGRGGGGRDAGYGTIVDASSVLLALTPAMELIAFQPAETAYTELARIKVADSATHAFPIISGNRVFVKDQTSLALMTLD
jgi:outer membrane protein assembly factor BamB